MIINTVLVGLGRIAMGLDLELDDPTIVATHARALNLDPDFRLLAAIDPNGAKRSEFHKKYGLEAFAAVDDIPAALPVDLVVIAVPTRSHLEVFGRVVDHLTPSFVFMEKPLGRNLNESQQIAQLASDRGITVYTNYPRRSDSSFQAIRELIQSNSLGPFSSGVCTYSGGVLNSASHFLDLLRGLFGNLQLYNSGPIDLIDGDLQGHFEVGNEAVRVAFNHLPERLLSHHTLDLVSAKGRLLYDFGGRTVRFWPSVEDSDFPAYRVFEGAGQEIPSNLRGAMARVCHSLYQAINGQPTDLASLDDSLQTHALIDELRSTMTNYDIA